jgi:hypothetical protein
VYGASQRVLCCGLKKIENGVRKSRTIARRSLITETKMNKTHPKHVFHASVLPAVILIAWLLFSASTGIVTTAAYVF